MVNYLKWGLAAAAIAAIVIFRDQIKGALTSAGTSLGEGVGGAASGFIGGTLKGLTSGPGNEPPREGQSAADYALFGAKRTVFGIPVPDFGQSGIPKAYGEVATGSTIAAQQSLTNRDIYGEETVTPQNREYLAAIEQAAARTRTVLQQPTGKQTFQTTYRQVSAEMPNAPIATRLAVQQQRIGAPSPLQVFYQLKQAGLSQTEASRRLREMGLAGR